MEKISTITLAFNRPDFIELQYNSLKKWVKDFTYTVFDNAPDNSIKDECDRLGIECVPIKIFSADPSFCVGVSLDKMWKTLQNRRGGLMYVDSDMFLIGALPKLKNYDMAFVPQVRGDIIYPWTGLMYFDMDTLPHPEELKWHVDYSLKNTDVGGLNHFYLKERLPHSLKLEMLTIIDDGKYSFNGSDVGDDKSKGRLEKIAKKYDFPHPYSFDLLSANNKPFVFHYKSASNYPSFYTPDYNIKKTEALCKILKK